MSNRGRPPSKPSHEEQEKVKRLLEDNAPLADIAAMIGRSVPWLRKYFSSEIFSRKKNRGAPPKPEFKPTQADREKVIRYIGCKMSLEDIGRVFGLSADELKAHFPDEVITGRAKYRANVLDELDAQMKDGVVGATNRLEAITVISEPDEGGKVRPGPNLGKKAAAAANAGAAAASGSIFAPPSPPRLAVDNTK